MAQRVNFLEKSAFVLTYRNMLIIAGAFCIFCTMIHGGFMMRHWMVKTKLVESNRIVNELTIRKEKALAVLQATQTRNTDATVTQALVSIFSKIPAWSSVLEDLSKKMPKQIWLKELRTQDIGERVDVKKIELSGKGASIASIAEFVSGLESSGKFQNVALVSSEKNEIDRNYSFMVNADVIFANRNW